MARVVVSALADSDRGSIIEYLAANAGQAAAERYNAAFRATFRRLADFPDSSPLRPELGASVRMALVYPFVVLYDHTGDTVTILRILHGKRNITRNLMRR